MYPSTPPPFLCKSWEGSTLYTVAHIKILSYALSTINLWFCAKPKPNNWPFCTSILHLFKKRIWSSRVEHFITCHNGYQVLRLAQVNDVKIFRGRVDAPLTVVRPSQKIWTCGFPALISNMELSDYLYFFCLSSFGCWAL